MKTILLLLTMAVFTSGIWNVMVFFGFLTEQLLYMVQASVLILILFLLLKDLAKLPKTSILETLPIFISIYVPVYVGVVSRIRYGQPFLMGLLSYRNYFFIFVFFYLYFRIAGGQITVSSIIKVLKVLGAIEIVVWLTLFLNRDSFPQLFKFEEEKGFVFSLPILGHPFVFLVVFYLTRVFFDSVIFLPAFLLLLVLIVAVFKSRNTFITILLLFIIDLFLFRRFKTRISTKDSLVYKIVIITSMVVVFISFSIFLSPHVFDLFDSFLYLKELFYFDLNKNYLPNSSINARLFQLKIVISEFQKNKLSVFTGFGNISYKFQSESWRKLYGYFYPDDLGIIGSIWSLGAINTLLILSPILTLIRRLFFNKFENRKINLYFMLVLNMILYYLISFVFTGLFYRSFYIPFLHYYLMLAQMQLSRNRPKTDNSFLTS